MDKEQLIDSLISRITDYEDQDWGMNIRLSGGGGLMPGLRQARWK